MKANFNVEFLEEAVGFLESIEQKAREKILYNVYKARITQDNKLFKKLSNDIWEFRTLYNKSHYRLFAFWDKTDGVEKLVISTHGIIKKTKKTPTKEIQKAIQIKEKYLSLKNKKK